MEGEDLLDLAAHELVAQRRGLTPPPLAVVGATHGVGPPVALGDPEPDLVLGEHLLEGLTISAARIEQCLGDLVAENLLEAALYEAATT